MTVVHVEDNPITRGKLADLLGVGDDNRLEGHEYISTDIVSLPEGRLRQGTVRALVLDLSLDQWSIRNMPRLLSRLLIEHQPPDPQDEQRFHAYRLALLAHAGDVPCALLTNWQDLLNPAKGVTLEGLRDAFHADAVFGKEDLSSCAAWVKKQL
jgi:hypothetical protein